jgi:hypothetical protein
MDWPSPLEDIIHLPLHSRLMAIAIDLEANARHRRCAWDLLLTIRGPALTRNPALSAAAVGQSAPWSA